MLSVKELFQRRQRRNRYRLRQMSNGQPRLSVFRSNKHIYAQIIDDRAGRTVAAASSMEAPLRTQDTKGSDLAQLVGKLVAERALAAGVKAVVFDRGGYRYHGRVKALGDAAREAGLAF